MKLNKRFGIGILVALGLVAIGPFLVPIPPLKGTSSLDNLADPDSKFVDVNGIKVHYKQAGSGKPIYILLHGFGASVFSWREVMGPLSEHGTVIAYDRPAFGLTYRPMPQGRNEKNPYSLDAQADLVNDLMDRLGLEKAVLVGNSAGGTVALQTALKYPQRVQALILVDPAVGGGDSSWRSWLMNIPQIDRLGPLFVRSIAGEASNSAVRKAWYDPSKITTEIISGYRKPLQAPNWDRALWEFTKANNSIDLRYKLRDLRMPVLVITGDNDHIISPQKTILLKDQIPGAEPAFLKNCGHVPHEECPWQFLDVIRSFIKSKENEV